MSTDTDALVPVAWIEHEWAWTGARRLHFERREPTVRDEVVNPVWTPLYGPDTIERLSRENAALKTVMVAAAEEIHAHWQAHCDAEGYGPQNLMRRLEEGIPSEYGYTAGAFAELTRERDEAVARERERCARLVKEQTGITLETLEYLASPIRTTKAPT